MSAKKTENKKRVTIRDIAKYCELSIGAVSSVLQNKSEERRIAKSTVEKIRIGIRELGYIPDLSARRLRKLSTSEFPLILAVLSTYEAPPVTIMSYLYQLRNLVDSTPEITSKYDVSIVLEMYSAGRLSEKKSLLTGDNFNAAIIANTTPQDDAYLKKAYLSYPVVLAGRDVQGYSGVVDANGGGTLAVELFKNSGCENLAILYGSPLTQLTFGRRDDFIKAATKVGAEVSEIIVPSLTEESAYDSMKKFLSSGKKIDAVYVTTDVLAIGAYLAIKEAGLSIPRDISIVGVGDYSYSSFFDPPLTTIGPERTENARITGEMLIGQLIGGFCKRELKTVSIRVNLRMSH